MSKVVLTDMRTETPTPGSSRAGPLSRVRSLSPLGIVVTRLETALAGLFLFASYFKLFESKNSPAVFSHSIEAFKLGLPDIAVRLATSVTPWVETIAAACLLLGIFSRAAAAVLGSLLIVFIVLIGSVLVRGLNTSCGCFGKMSPFCPDKVSMCNIWQNLILLGMVVLIVAVPRSRLVSSHTGA